MSKDDLRTRSEYGDTFVRLFVKDELQQRLRPFSKTALEFFRKYCFEECNDSDRLKCILRPCTEIIEGNNRQLLDVYIDSGIKKEDLPLFCYSQRQQELSKLLSGKEHKRGLHDDKAILLEDFLDILFPDASKPLKRALQRRPTFIKTFTGKLNERGGFTVYVSQDDYILFSNEDEIFSMDLDRELVILNPSEHRIRELLELKGFNSFFSRKHNLPTELIENGFGWDLLQFQVYMSDKDFTKEEISLLQEFLVELRKDKAGLFSGFYVSDRAVYVSTDIYYHSSENEKYFNYNDKKLLVNSLARLFSAMKNIREAIEQKLKGSNEKAEPETKTSSSH